MNWQAPGSPAELRAEAQAARQDALNMIVGAGLGHIGGDFSALDIVTVLYGAILRVDPANPRATDRDRFIMSKGHATGALYVTLARRGFFATEELRTFAKPLSRLGGHPDRTKLPGVEANTGPLGHGLPVAVGAALAAKLSGQTYRSFVLTGDGELQEGSNWEAAMTAAHNKLDNLVVTVDRNHLQQGDRTENTMALESLAAKWAAFGFEVVHVDGHDHKALLEVYSHVPVREGKPTVVIARTTKGKGVSFMEDGAAWHHKVPSAAECAAALRELQTS
ncbi:MAG: transketolase [Deltaproteobacteria bacterium]|nr:transketolase [Deltaproteobacteria bacterium]